MRLVTFFPERPERSVPSFRSRIARATLAAARLPYFRAFFFASRGDLLPRGERGKKGAGQIVEERARRRMPSSRMKGAVVLGRDGRLGLRTEVARSSVPTLVMLEPKAADREPSGVALGLRAIPESAGADLSADRRWTNPHEVTESVELQGVGLSALSVIGDSVSWTGLRGAPGGRR